MTELTPNAALIGGHRIACGSHGTGTPLILIHGTPSFSHIWRNVVPDLVAAGHRIFVYDLLGFGRSERPADPAVDTSVSAQVPILEALMDHWNLETAHIVAHDIGGAVAQRFGIFHSGKVRTLTLIDTVSFDSWPSARTREQMQAGLDALIQAPEAEHRVHFRTWLETTVADVERFRADGLEAYLDMISGTVGQASYFQHQMRHYDPRHTVEISDRLGDLAALPVQILWGEDDAWQVPDWAYRLHTAIPGSSLRILPHCGHFAMEDKPAEIAAQIAAFTAAHEE